MDVVYSHNEIIASPPAIIIMFAAKVRIQQKLNSSHGRLFSSLAPYHNRPDIECGHALCENSNFIVEFHEPMCVNVALKVTSTASTLRRHSYNVCPQFNSLVLCVLSFFSVRGPNGTSHCERFYYFRTKSISTCIIAVCRYLLYDSIQL